ncbi:hypothetical protein [Trinickia dinghuensis]|uniref:Uncharacterized protein n=1 Tax=Trinickia dinghuensis TaxID=2291023 RepID=A0A3D8K147_9BURK|nr:hypothetical protein [Trinickia dinghuensis]RDU99177.1 hypothetical protein DWV00_08610 [Trinickia dinghuensis]
MQQPNEASAKPFVSLEGLRAKLLAPRDIVRDEQGWLSHPELPVCDEGTEIDKFLDAFGIETSFVSMEYDLPALHDRWCDAQLDDCSEWIPTAPAGSGWMLFDIYDTEDGPYAMFGRDRYAAEQEIKKQRTRNLRVAVDRARAELAEDALCRMRGMSPPSPTPKEATRSQDIACVAEGWKIVPVEPPDEMRIPSYRLSVNWPTRQQIYRDMIAAAPQPPQPSASVPEDAGWQALRHAVERLQSTGSYSDDEGESTNALSDLLYSQSRTVAWAVARWNAEVSERPLVNVHRRTLDDTWRQVIRHFGGDPKELIGPSHDELLAAAPAAPAAAPSEDAYIAQRMTETLAEVYATIIGEDMRQEDESLNAIERVKKAAQVLRLEVDLYRAQRAESAGQPGPHAAITELRNIANAKRFDKAYFDDDESFADWAQSRARHALAASTAATGTDWRYRLIGELGCPEDLSDEAIIERVGELVQHKKAAGALATVRASLIHALHVPPRGDGEPTARLVYGEDRFEIGYTLMHWLCGILAMGAVGSGVDLRILQNARAAFDFVDAAMCWDANPPEQEGEHADTLRRIGYDLLRPRFKLPWPEVTKYEEGHTPKPFSAGPAASQAAEPNVPAQDALPLRDATRTDEQQGLYRKYDVRRLDGSDAPGRKHADCEHFVLDMTHDPYAAAALRTYAQLCFKTHPFLAVELDERYSLRDVALDPGLCALRVLTYKHQPSDNVVAWRLGEACRNAAEARAGDYIDLGLQLLKELQEKGYGVVQVECIDSKAPKADR